MSKRKLVLVNRCENSLLGYYSVTTRLLLAYHSVTTRLLLGYYSVTTRLLLGETPQTIC